MPDDTTKSDGEENSESPKKTAIGAGKGGIVPPIERRFAKGNKGGPGITPAGDYIRREMNKLVKRRLTMRQLEKIAKDPDESCARASAAGQLLRGMELPDMTDFAGYMKGEHNLEDLRGMGINTRVVKKVKQVTRKVPIGDGEMEEVIQREIELHDHAGTELERTMNQTGGMPKTTGETTVKVAANRAALENLPDEDLLKLREIACKVRQSSTN